VAAAANPTSPPTGWNARSNSSTSGSNSPTTGLPELQAALEAEITTRQGHAAHEHQQLDRELLGLEGERRKLLEAYYADAIDLGLLRQEQSRISQRTGTIEARRRALTANLDQWQTVLETAGRLATNCGAAYRHADPRTRKLLNNAVIDRIDIRDGRVTHVDYNAPFDLLFGGSGIEYRTVVEHSISYSNPTELHERLSTLADAASDVARPSR
jgi:hypothetical protein